MYKKIKYSVTETKLKNSYREAYNEKITLDKAIERIRACDQEISEYNKLTKEYKLLVNEEKKLINEFEEKRRIVWHKMFSERKEMEKIKVPFFENLFGGEKAREKDKKLQELGEEVEKSEKLIKQLEEEFEIRKEKIRNKLNERKLVDGKSMSGKNLYNYCIFQKGILKVRKSGYTRLIDEIKQNQELEQLKARAASSEGEVRSQATRIKNRLKKQLEILNVCPYCCKALEINSAHLDHIYPVSKGGKSNQKNIVLVCGSCNIQKGKKTLRNFILENNLDRNTIERNLELLGKDF